GYGTAEHLGELVQGRRQVPDDLELREIHLLDDGGTVPDVDDGRPGLIHRERRLLGRIVTDGDDDVGRIDRVVDIVTGGQGRRAHVQIRRPRHRSLAHLR